MGSTLGSYPKKNGSSPLFVIKDMCQCRAVRLQILWLQVQILLSLISLWFQMVYGIGKLDMHCKGNCTNEYFIINKIIYFLFSYQGKDSIY